MDIKIRKSEKDEPVIPLVRNYLYQVKKTKKMADLVVGPDLQLTVDAQHQQAQHDHVTW
jgi:hypothetical protein